MNDERDEFHGVGGSYVLDPDTGKRRRVEHPTKPAEPAPAPPVEPQPQPAAAEDASGVRRNRNR